MPMQGFGHGISVIGGGDADNYTTAGRLYFSHMLETILLMRLTNLLRNKNI